MAIGEKIRKFRTAWGLSQKQLAIMSGMSEPAVRNYELGNRNPNEKQIEKIARALEISPYALSNPVFDTGTGLIHALFQIEDMYVLKPQEINGQMVLAFDRKHAMTREIGLWYEALQKLKNGDITQEEYDLWRYRFPGVEAEREIQ